MPTNPAGYRPPAVPSAIPDNPHAIATTRSIGLAAGLAIGLALGWTPRVCSGQPADPSFAPLVEFGDEDEFEGRVIRGVTVRTPSGQNDEGETVYGRLPDELDNRARNAIRSYPGAPYRT